MANKKQTLTLADIDALKQVFATKDDLKKQLKETRADIVDTIIEHLDKNYVKQSDFEELKEDISHLPTKDEFYAESAKVYKEVKDYREEQALLSHQVSRISDRVDRLEKN